MIQRWAITDARGNILRTVVTKGWHPCHERGEPAPNVMRTHPIDDGLLAQACRFERGEVVLDEAGATAAAHRAILARFCSFEELGRALAFGLSDEDRDALQSAFRWRDGQ